MGSNNVAPASAKEPTKRPAMRWVVVFRRRHAPARAEAVAVASAATAVVEVAVLEEATAVVAPLVEPQIIRTPAAWALDRAPRSDPAARESAIALHALPAAPAAVT